MSPDSFHILLFVRLVGSRLFFTRDGNHQGSAHDGQWTARNRHQIGLFCFNFDCKFHKKTWLGNVTFDIRESLPCHLPSGRLDGRPGPERVQGGMREGVQLFSCTERPPSTSIVCFEYLRTNRSRLTDRGGVPVIIHSYRGGAPQRGSRARNDSTNTMA